MVPTQRAPLSRLLAQMGDAEEITITPFDFKSVAQGSPLDSAKSSGIDQEGRAATALTLVRRWSNRRGGSREEAVFVGTAEFSVCNGEKLNRRQISGGRGFSRVPHLAPPPGGISMIARNLARPVTPRRAAAWKSDRGWLLAAS